MRSISGILMSGVVAMMVTGCNLANDFRYSHEGIGSQLYVAESVAATANLEAYIGLLCQQAGLPLVVRSDGTTFCDITRSTDWALLVQAGMNDIDSRCDGYLAWLDDKRRTNEPFLKQLAATSAATLGILDATSAGVQAITITGIAFGLAANTFTNFNARILSLEQSTVQSVVLDSQRKYRQSNMPSSVDSRPAAIYYLRNYLRICLPFSIETTVNNTVTVFHRAGANALENDTLFTRKLILDPNERFRIPGPGPRNPAADRLNEYERSAVVTEALIRSIQKTLCVSPIDGRLGLRGSDTRTAISEFFVGLGQPAADELSRRRAARLKAAISAFAQFENCTAANMSSPRKVGEHMKNL